MTNQVGVLGAVQITGPDHDSIDIGGKRRRLLAALALNAGVDSGKWASTTGSEKKTKEVMAGPSAER